MKTIYWMLAVVSLCLGGSLHAESWYVEVPFENIVVDESGLYFVTEGMDPLPLHNMFFDKGKFYSVHKWTFGPLFLEWREDSQDWRCDDCKCDLEDADVLEKLCSVLQRSYVLGDDEGPFEVSEDDELEFSSAGSVA